MNEIERLQGELVAMSRRMRRLEVIFESRGVVSEDSREAERVAEQLGFEADVIYLPATAGTKTHARARRELAGRLSLKGWTHERIARAMGCSERSVRRILKARVSGQEKGSEGTKGT